MCFAFESSFASHVYLLCIFMQEMGGDFLVVLISMFFRRFMRLVGLLCFHLCTFQLVS